MAADMEEVLIADMQHSRDALRISFIRTVGSKCLLNKKYLPLLVLSMDRLNTLGWTLSLTLTVQSRIWMSLSLLPSLATRPWCLLPAQNQDLWPRERDFTSSDDDEHNTDSNFLLLFADVGITLTLLEGLTEVDVLHIALGCRFTLDIFTISQRHSPTLFMSRFLMTLSSFHFEL